MAVAPGRKLLVSWLVFGISLPLIPATARAEDKTIVMLEVEGEREPRLRKTLERMVKTGHEVLPGGTYRDAARRLRAQKLTPNNVKKVCGYLKVDGVLDGTLVQDEDGYRLVVRLRSAADGIIEKQIPVRLTQPFLSERLSNDLAQRLMTAIDNLPPVDKAGQENTRVAAARKGADAPDDTEEEGDGAVGGGPGKKGKAMAGAGGKGKKGSKGKSASEDERPVRVAAAGKGKKKVGPNQVEPDDDLREPERVASAREEARQGRDRRAKKSDDPELRDERRDDERASKKQRVAAKDGDDGSDGDDGERGEGEGEGEDDGEGEGEGEGEGAGEGGGGDGEGEGSGEVASSVDRDSESAAQSTGPRNASFLVNLGVSFMGRKLSFDYSGAAEQAPPGYSGTPVPGAYLAAEVYPVGFGGEKGFLADLGIGVVFDRVISLNTTVPDGNAIGMGTVSLPTRMWRYGANLRYRHNFGSEANGYSIHGSVGYNTAGFSIEQPQAPAVVDVPNVNYKYVDIGLGGRIPISSAFSVLAEAKFLAPMDTGPIQEVEQYGPATVSGFEGELALEYQITSSIHARAGGRFMQLGFSFDGDGQLDDRDGNGENDVSGASDRFLGGFLTGGYSF